MTEPYPYQYVKSQKLHLHKSQIPRFLLLPPPDRRTQLLPKREKVTWNAMSALDTSKTTVLEQLGGEPALVAAVDAFYARLLEDAKLQPFFVGRNIPRLKAHQLNFMRFAFTKIPDDLDVPGLILTKHKSLFAMGLDETHFDVVAGHFVTTLEGLKVKPEAIAAAVAVIGPLRSVFAQGAVKYGKKALPFQNVPVGTWVIAGAIAVAAVLILQGAKH